MATVVALGETHELVGFALAGARVVHAADAAALVAAWAALDADVGLAILSPLAATALDAVLDDRPDVLTVVMP